MTCASCVSRVERKLGKLDGVEASVNLPLESAVVRVPAGVPDQVLLDTVKATGYSARLKDPEEPGVQDGDDGSPTAARLRPRLLTAAVLTVPVLLISMVPALQFPGWGWIVFALSAPVATWAAWPFHRAALVNARHGASTMDTLVSIGVAAAFGFSTWQLLSVPDLTAHPGMDMGTHALYFEVAAVIVTFLLLGRYLEANAKQAGRERPDVAAEPRCEGRPRPAHRGRRTHRTRHSGLPAHPGGRDRGAPRGEDPHGRRGGARAQRRRHLPADRRVDPGGGRAW
jgi:Cu+-exporting ATPase